MKIVHISHLYHPSSGGVQFFFKNISERLVKDYGDDVTVVTTDSYYGPERRIFKKIEPSQEIINGVKVLRFPYRRWHIGPYSIIKRVFSKLSIGRPESLALKAYGPYSPQMKKYLMTVEADAFCASSSNYYFMQLPLWRKCNFFYYGSIHLNENEEKPFLYPKQLQSMNASTLYLANTSYEKEQLVKAGVIEDKIFVLGTGVDVKPFLNVDNNDVSAFRASLNIPEGASITGYVGRIERPKNVITLIKAFQLLAIANPDTYLLIAGPYSNYAEELTQLCSSFDKSIMQRIKWVFDFAAEDKPLIFHAIDMLVLPSYNESFGLVFLEAWSCRKPVIGTSIGAVRDVIDEGKDGLLIHENSETELAEKIRILLSSSFLRTKMGNAGFEKVNAKYTWDMIVSRLRQCYINGAHKSENKRVAANV